MKNIGSLDPNKCECLIPLLIILLRTYPRPSFEGKTPSAKRNELALKWSAITLKLDIFLSSCLTFVASDIELINFLKWSVW